MDSRNVQTTASKPSSIVSGIDQQSKCVNALDAKLLALQMDRKLKMDNASAIRKSMDSVKHDVPQLQNALKCLVENCNDAKRIHESLLSLLPVNEKERHDVWFKAKMIPNSDVICETKVFLTMGSENVHTGLPTALNADIHANADFKAAHESVCCGSGINQNNSVSNVGSKRSHKSGSSGRSGASRDQCVLSILPVKLKSAKGSRIITTYAFLDPGSSATFCTDRLMQKLNVIGKRTSFLLRTMGQEKVVPAYTLSGLEVSEMDRKTFIPCPKSSHRKNCQSLWSHLRISLGGPTCQRCASQA